MATVVETPTSTKTKGRILIVDDELVVRDSLGKWFTSEGYMARPVPSAREALEVIQHTEFDIALIDMVAPTEATVLITGESGTGKEVVARAIHAAGPRRYMPMVTIHCGALTETLLESELFGHEKGAFTGAQYRKKGKFEVADGGTVFLDEISDISLKTQTDLLRVLQEKEIVRVGGNQQLKVDFRAIAATNKNLEMLVKAGSFRPDLYYRLHVFCIDIPPLRDRREDIPLLVNHFLNKFCLATSRPVPTIAPEAVDLLMRHDWPGNVRE